MGLSFPTYHLLTTFIFNDIPAFCEYLLCNQRHSRSVPTFPQWSFVFNNIPASFRQKKNSFLELLRFPEASGGLSE